MTGSEYGERGFDRRRHFRLDCDWAVAVAGVELNGAATRFDAKVRNVSMSGLFLEAAVAANLWADKPLSIDLPGGVGPVRAVVRRFLEYGSDGCRTTRWGVEFIELTVTQRAQLARLMFTEARLAQGAVPAPGSGGEPAIPRGSALGDAVAARPAPSELL